MRSSLSSEDVIRVSEDLSDCRTRLDAGIEENRRNRQVIQDINDQLQRYRKRAQAESVDSLHQIANTSTFSTTNNHHHHQYDTNNISMPSLTIDIPLNTTATIHSSRHFYSNPSNRESRHRNKSTGSRAETHSTTTHHFRHRSSPRLSINGHYEEENIEDLFIRLKEELFKNNTLEEVNDMLREENDAALAVNENLRVDASNLSKQLQLLQQQQTSESMRYRSENTRYRNQLETQHRKLITLWKEFTAVKRQLHELRTSAANDMDRQMTEFTRCATLMRKAIRSSEQKSLELRDEMRREKDEVLDETLRQLNTATENYMKSEETANERLRDLKRREEEMRKLREKMDEFRDVMELLVKMGGASKTDEPMDVARKVKKVLTSKNAQVEESKEAARQAEKERDRARKDVEKEERMRRDAQEAERKRASLYTQREQEIKRLEDELRKAGDKLRHVEDAKLAAESQASLAQVALADAHRQHQQFIDDVMSRHRDELASRDATHDDLLKARDVDEKQRLEKEREDKERRRREVEEMRETIRKAKGEETTRRLEKEERDERIREMEREREEMQRKQEEAREYADRRDVEMEEWQRKLEESQEKEADLRRQLAEAHSTIQSLETDSAQNQTDTQEVRSDLCQMTEQLADLNQDIEQKQEELDQLQNALQERNVQIQQHRADAQQFRAQYDEACEELDILKAEIRRVHDDSSQKLVIELQKFEDVSKQLTNAREENSRLNGKWETSQRDMEQFQMTLNSKSGEEEELRSLLEDLRRNFDKLTNDLKQREISLEAGNGENLALKAQILNLEELRKQDLKSFEDMEKSTDLETSAKLKTLLQEKMEVQNSLRALESANSESNKRCSLLQEELDLLKLDHSHVNEEIQKAKEKLKKEVDKLNAENEQDRAEWQEERARIESSSRLQVAQLEEQIQKLEDTVRDSEYLKEQEAQKAKEKILELEEAIRKANSIVDERVEEVQEVRKARESEFKRILEEKEAMHLENTKMTSMILELKRRCEKMEEEIGKSHVMVKDRESSIHALESNTTELIEKLEKLKQENEKLKDDVEISTKKSEEYHNLRSELGQKSQEDRKRIEELSDGLREAQKAQNQHRMRSVQLEEKRSELEASNIQYQNKIKQLELQLLDRQAKQEVSGDLVKKMEKDAESMLKAAKQEQHRLGDLEKTRKMLEEQNVKLADDLATVRAAFEAKRETSKSAISDVLVQYRKAEEKANEGVIENQKLRNEIHSLMLKIERLEQSLRDSQKRYDNLQTTLIEVQRTAMEYSSTTHRPQNRSLHVEIPRSVSSHTLDHTTSTQNDTISSSVGVTLQFLKSRIEQLEKDRAEIAQENERVRDTIRQRDEEVAEKQRQLEIVERQRKLRDEEVMGLEAKYTRDRRIWDEIEETQRVREAEVRAMRAKISTLELGVRERDAQILRLRKDVDITTGQLNSARGHSEHAHSLAGTADSRIQGLEESLTRCQKERDALVAQVKRDSAHLMVLERRVEQLERERLQILGDLGEEQKNHQATRNSLHEARNRQTNRAQEKEHEAQMRWQETHNDITAKNQQLSRECEKLRSEYRDTVTRMTVISQKSQDDLRKNEELSSKVLILQNTVSALKKFEDEWKRLEAEMRDELKVLRKDKIQNTAEIEELRRKTLRGETERKELEGIRMRLEREIGALKRHVDSLEEDKQRTEKAVKETMHERRGIDKSLASMERENQQLYRNCQQLQQQIQQLEKDAGNRPVAKLAKEHGLLEARIGALIEEKRQLQSVLDQRDATYIHKRKLLESQIQLLREQLEAERRKRHRVVVPATQDTQTPTTRRTTTQHFRKIEYRHYYQRSSSTSRLHPPPPTGTQLPAAGDQQHHQIHAITHAQQQQQLSPLSQTDSYTSEPQHSPKIPF